jgi:indole-3-glycerol phosphate synthase
MSRADWLAEKRAEIATLADLPLTNIVPSRRDFTQFVATQKQGIALVPRLQRRNPASRRTWPDLQVAEFARACDDAEAGALAVRTAALFGGALADLDAVAAAVSAPVLRDDLCLHRQQIYQSRLHGADAVVLPAADLDAALLRELVAVTSSMHMASVIEIADEAALSRRSTRTSTRPSSRLTVTQTGTPIECAPAHSPPAFRAIAPCCCSAKSRRWTTSRTSPARSTRPSSAMRCSTPAIPPRR